MSSCSSSRRSSQRRWSGPDSSAGGLGGQRHVPVAMACLEEGGLAAGRELFRGVLADRVQEPEPRLAAGHLLGLDEALVEQGHHPVDDVAADLRRRPADRLRRLEVEAAGEHRQAVEQPLGVLVEDVVAPGDRGAQGLLARRQVARAGGQQVELVLEPAEDRLGRQELDPRGGQLDRQRHAVEPGADGRHGGRVLVGHGEARPDRHRALDEQAHGGVLLDRGRVDRCATRRAWPVARARSGGWDRAVPAGPAPGTPARPRRAGPRGW